MILFIILIMMILTVAIALVYWPFLMKSGHQQLAPQPDPSSQDLTEILPRQSPQLLSVAVVKKQLKIDHWRLLPAVIVLLSFSIGLYSQTGHWRQLQNWQRVMQDLPALRASFNANKLLNHQQRQDLTLALRSQLQQQPNNWQDWLMLGRLALIRKDAISAIEAFAKAYQIAPQQQEVALSYIQLLMRSNDPADNQQANQLLRQRLQRYHPDITTLRLLATSSYELGYLDTAIAAWQLMLMMLPEDNPYHDMLIQSIKQAEARQNAEP